MLQMIDSPLPVQHVAAERDGCRNGVDRVETEALGPTLTLLQAHCSPQNQHECYINL